MQEDHADFDQKTIPVESSTSEISGEDSKADALAVVAIISILVVAIIFWLSQQ